MNQSHPAKCLSGASTGAPAGPRLLSGRVHSRQLDRATHRHILTKRVGRRALLTVASLSSLPLPEGSLGLPLLGENISLLLDGDRFGEQRIAQHGKLWKTNILGGPTVMVYSEEDIRRVLGGEGRLVEALWPAVTKEVVGAASLNLLTGERHAEVKRVFNEAFTARAVAPLVPRMAEIVQDELASWAREVAGGQSAGSGLQRMQVMAMRVFIGVVLGMPPVREDSVRLQALMEKLQGGFLPPPIDLPFTPYGQALRARTEVIETLRGAVRGAFARGEAALLRPPQPPVCILDQLILAVDSDGKVLPEEELLEGLVAGLFGNASSGPTLSKVLQQLALQPDILSALRYEQQEAGEAATAELTAEALGAMPLAEAAAREALRFRPAVPAMFRTALQDFELSGRRIPKGWRVWCYTGDGVTKYETDKFAPAAWVAGPQPQSACPFQAAASAHARQGTARQLVAAATASTSASTSGASGASTSGSTSSSAGGDSSGGGGGGAVGGVSQGVQVVAPEFTLPFGAGPRGCLGRSLVETQLQLLVILLSRGYEWGVTDPKEAWALVPTPRPAAGLPMSGFRKLESR